MGIKKGPKRIAKSTKKPDRRQRDNQQKHLKIPHHLNHIKKEIKYFISRFIMNRIQAVLKRTRKVKNVFWRTTGKRIGLPRMLRIAGSPDWI